MHRLLLSLTPGLALSCSEQLDNTAYPPPTLLEVTCRGTDNPLRYRCVVEIEPAQPVTLSHARADGLSVVRSQLSDEALTSHDLPVYFLAPATEYTITAMAAAWPSEGVSRTFTSGLPPAYVRSTLEATGASSMGLIGTHLPCNDTAIAVIYDTHTGDLVWYHELARPGTLGVLDMVQFTEDHTILGESMGDLIEVDLTGADLLRLEELDSQLNGPGCCTFHHDVFKRGDVYYLMYQDVHEVDDQVRGVLDVVVLLDGTGAEIVRWFPEDHLPIPDDWSGDWLHTNTIYVDEAGDIYLSWRHQDAVSKIVGDPGRPDFGTPIWILQGSDHGDLGSGLTLDWSQVEGSDSFQEQHSLTLTPDGRVMLLDNLHGRGLIIDVDEGSSAAVVEGAYRTVEPICGPQGTARTTSAGNPVVGCSGDWVREYDGVTEEKLWEARVQCLQEPPDRARTGAVRWYPLDGW
ncbi:MAG TPA: hypothetical protein ENK18_03795 [Deltaproteobacteria bacterium]|nr:hypothetical protein [Deltaproteobacteria bacterium]